jgi:hypothetical protein
VSAAGDLVCRCCGELSPVLNRWTRWLYDELGAQHHWDLPAGARIIRVFLLPGWLEIDLTFAPEEEFGPRGPQWRTVFGQARPLEPFPAPDPRHLIGLAWHHALHARVCIERGRWWQARPHQRSPVTSMRRCLDGLGRSSAIPAVVSSVSRNRDSPGPRPRPEVRVRGSNGLAAVPAGQARDGDGRCHVVTPPCSWLDLLIRSTSSPVPMPSRLASATSGST